MKCTMTYLKHHQIHYEPRQILDYVLALRLLSEGTSRGMPGWVGRCESRLLKGVYGRVAVGSCVSVV